MNKMKIFINRFDKCILITISHYFPSMVIAIVLFSRRDCLRIRPFCVCPWCCHLSVNDLQLQMNETNQNFNHWNVVTTNNHNLPKVDQTADDDASLIGSICGCRRANCTCNVIPVTVFVCISLMERSADSTLAYVMNPRPFSISIDTLTILPNVANWLRRNSSVILLPDTQIVLPVRCFSLRCEINVGADVSCTFFSVKPRSSRSRSVANCWYTANETQK